MCVIFVIECVLWLLLLLSFELTHTLSFSLSVSVFLACVGRLRVKETERKMVHVFACMHEKEKEGYRDAYMLKRHTDMFGLHGTHSSI